MPKSLVLGNGNILIGFDKNGLVRDVYYPYVGLENHTSSRCIHKIGVYIDGQLHWLEDPSWQISINYKTESLTGDIKAENKDLGILLQFTDVVYNEKNIFIREVVVKNLTDQHKNFKIFFHQQFKIYESNVGDTGYFDPDTRTIIHYKGRRVFLINAMVDYRGFDDYCVGNFGIENKEGTFKDAESGVLSKNPIEHGLVDSVIGLSFELQPKAEEKVYYWMVIAKDIKEVRELNKYVIKKSPQYLIKTTGDFWQAWVNKQNFHFMNLDQTIIDQFKKSLFIVRTHVDNQGAIIASCDSDMLEHGRDTYSYMWPRDGALTALALDRVGDGNVAKRFFEFCNDVITEEGYFMHKYRSDKSSGSSWHPWVKDGKMQLPIQEDETALVIFSLWKHYKFSKDLEFIESIYNSLIKRAAEFMVLYCDPNTDLPKPSYDLWEEKLGVSTFTCAAVYGALIAASNFASLLGKKESELIYKDAAEKIRGSIMKNLYDEEEGIFYKMINTTSNGKIMVDKTIDFSSVYGVFKFEVLDLKDERLHKAMHDAIEKLSVKTEVGGIARYQGDMYYSITSEVPGNPWFITTLWMVQYYIACAKEEKDFDIVRKWFGWVVKNAQQSGILSEQLNPFSGEQVSAAPLTWSHSEFVVTVIQYLEKLEELGICVECIPVK